MLKISPKQRADVLINQFLTCRQKTVALCESLEIDDYGLQNHPDCSPPKWHLAHTSWFFEEMILKPYLPGYKSLNENYSQLFNSYYESINNPLHKIERRFMSRPGLQDVQTYRAHIEEAIQELGNNEQHYPTSDWPRIAFLIQLGIHHEQQHQELLLMDILYNFWSQPLQPALWKVPHTIVYSESRVFPIQWQTFEEGLYWIGAEPSENFCYDNEEPVHRRFLNSFEIANRLVTNAEYRDFIEDKGYERPELWLSDGWAWKNKTQRSRPLYWGTGDFKEHEFSLFGWRPRRDETPVSHISYFEAEAFSKWAGARLPTEFEWELAASSERNESEEHFLENAHFMALPSDSTRGLQQMKGPLWQWTQSAYEAYPGYHAFYGSLGEYNSKFMCNQVVLRGGCFATPVSHYRHSYRNFYYPPQSWAFTGFRLARDNQKSSLS